MLGIYLIIYSFNSFISMKEVVNPVTGQIEYQFGAKMLTELSQTTRENSNGKKFKVCTIEFADRHGEIQKVSAMVYEGNYNKGLKVGETYLATARKGDNGQAYIQMSHLPYTGNTATTDMFGFDEAVAEAPAIARKVSAIAD